MPDADPGRGPGRAAESTACLERTRSAVLNVLVVVGAGIAASGWVLGRHEPDAALPWGAIRTGRALMAALAVLGAASYLTLRVVTGREMLRDPARRASRFFRGRVASAVIAALAIPLGFAHGWLVDPNLKALAPYWVAALGLGFLALPRGHELDDFE